VKVLKEKETTPKKSFSSKRMRRIKEDYFKVNKTTSIDYRNVEFLKMFIHPNNRILPAKKTGTKPRFQRKVAKSIK
jgi:ribosomal protein S18